MIGNGNAVHAHLLSLVNFTGHARATQIGLMMGSIEEAVLDMQAPETRPGQKMWHLWKDELLYFNESRLYLPAVCHISKQHQVELVHPLHCEMVSKGIQTIV